MSSGRIIREIMILNCFWCFILWVFYGCTVHNFNWKKFIWSTRSGGWKMYFDVWFRNSHFVIFLLSSIRSNCFQTEYFSSVLKSKADVHYEKGRSLVIESVWERERKKSKPREYCFDINWMQTNYSKCISGRLRCKSFGKLIWLHVEIEW